MSLSSIGSAAEEPAKVIAGWVEKVSFTATGQQAKAKLDSGALTSSIHAIGIQRFKEDGKKWVRFTLPATEKDGEATTLERELERRVRIKDHDDEGDSRPVVLLELCFNGRVYPVQFNLTDRSRFIYPVLLGRRFLAGVAVIDPQETFLTNSACSETTS